MKCRVLPNKRGCTCVLWEATETTRWDLTAATALQHIHQPHSHDCMYTQHERKNSTDQQYQALYVYHLHILKVWKMQDTEVKCDFMLYILFTHELYFIPHLTSLNSTTLAQIAVG